MTIPRTILVTSNCATAGIALGLKALLPHTRIKVAPITEVRLMTPEQIAQRLEGVDLWVTIPQTPEVLEQFAGTPMLHIPVIRFNGYHPDIIYVMDEERRIIGGAKGQDYHSAIALWSYHNGLNREQTCALFCPDVYEALGYTDGWRAALNELSDHFSRSDLDFRDFYPAVLEHAPFMHTLNHPRAEAVARLTKQIAASITGDRAQLKIPLERVVQDFLAQDSYWPTYPGIAEAYGLEGHYIWKLCGDTMLNGVEPFVDASFDAYEAFSPGAWASWTMLHLDREFFDQTLSSRVRPL